MKFFTESYKHHKDEPVEIFIQTCKNKINIKQNKTEFTEPSEPTTSGKDTNKTNKTIDLECEEIIRKKDFYEILNINKEATDEEIKRSYKKLAIKFHPDKNQSIHAAEAFKKVYIQIKFLLKISHAFTTLKDPEKKAFYDKYGSEEELREKYFNQQQHYYQEEEMDPFDLFEMFFTAGMGGNVHGRGGRMFRRHRQPEQDQDQHQHQQHRVKINKYMALVQLIPFFILILFSVIPYIFQSVFINFF